MSTFRFMKILLYTLITLFSVTAFSQEVIIIDTLNQNFKKELTVLYKKRVTLQKVAMNKSITDKEMRKEVGAAYLELSNGFIKNINNGFIVENETYSQFLQGILENIISNNPEYADIANTEILLSFGTSPNAYAIGNDIVVVLIPLIKNIENEYELAFIICHEIAHNLLEHSYEGMVEYASMMLSSEIKEQTREIEKQKYNKAQIASGLYKDIIYGKRRNSRKLEHQADSLGFVLFKNAFKGREYQAVQSLRTLDQIDKERDSLTATDYSKLFNTEKAPFKNEWIENDELSTYKYDKRPRFWQIDSLKTHPDCKMRAGFIEQHFMVKPANTDEPSENFYLLKKSSAYNHILGLYAIEEYGKSLYETLLLLKKNPDDAFLNKMTCLNLKKLQQAQKTYTLNKYLDTVNPRYSNSYNTFLSFLREIRKSEMNEFINHYSAIK